MSVKTLVQRLECVTAKTTLQPRGQKQNRNLALNVNLQQILQDLLQIRWLEKVIDDLSFSLSFCQDKHSYPAFSSVR